MISGTATFEFCQNGWGQRVEIPSGITEFEITRVIIWSSHDIAIISRRRNKLTAEGWREEDIEDARVPTAIGWQFVHWGMGYG